MSQDENIAKEDENITKEDVPLVEISPAEEPVKAQIIVKKYIKKITAEKTASIQNWQPKTKLGKMVREGKITNMSDAIATRLSLREPEIVDILLPDLEDEVLDVNMVQRMTDSGRRVRFAVTIVVGNSNGFVGIGHAKGKEVRLAILKAIDCAKINIIQIKRGCGSWECGCGLPHSLPFEVTGKCGSAVITLRPAPRGVSLAAADVAKHILRLGGVKDAWTFTNGKTRTTVNFAYAAFDALKRTGAVKVTKAQQEKLKIITGGIAQ